MSKVFWIKILRFIASHLDKKDLFPKTDFDNKICNQIINWCDTKLKEFNNDK